MLRRSIYRSSDARRPAVPFGHHAPMTSAAVPEIGGTEFMGRGGSTGPKAYAVRAFDELWESRQGGRR